LLANAWEEEDEIVLITCRLQDPGFNVANWAVKEKQENLVDEL
jgi:carotenoid cleavage dioxygenase